MVNPSAMESRYRDRPESNSRQNFVRFTGTRVTRVNSRVPEKKRPRCLEELTYHVDMSHPVRMLHGTLAIRQKVTFGITVMSFIYGRLPQSTTSM